MVSVPQQVMIIGGGQAGGRLAQLLSADGDRFAVTLICRDPHPPYQRPPLSKGVLLGTTQFDGCAIWPKDADAWRTVDLRLDTSAMSIDLASKSVTPSRGDPIGYDSLVIATGSRLRRLSVPGAALRGVHGLRSFDDAIGIAQNLSRGKRLVIVGGGFIGLEIAAAARTRGLHTLVVEASNRLLARIVPPTVAARLAERHIAAGVRLKMGAMVERFVSDGRGAVKAAELSTGETVACDLAVFGVGVAADTELARAAGLDIEVGVLTDASLRTSDPHVFACGDIASFMHPLYKRRVRVEAWQNAEDHARVVAGVLRGESLVCDTVPFFWSDQYDLAVQVVGLPQFAASTVARNLDGDAIVLFHLDARGLILGATGLGKSTVIGREIGAARQLIAASAHPARPLLGDRSVRLRDLVRQHAGIALSDVG